jgi:cell division initiation protein
MDITPLDVSKKQFSTAFRGYDLREVDTFLEMVTLEMEDLARRNHGLKEALAKKEGEIQEIKARENSLRNTLEGLQQILQEERTRAEQKGKQVIREAELKAAGIVNQAREEQASLRNGNEHLQRMRREFLAKLGSLVESYKKIVDQDQQLLEEELRIDSDVQMI